MLPRLSPSKLAVVLGTPAQDKGSRLVQVGRHLSAKHLLLVLDNYEHLLDGVGVVTGLLEACPQLKLLVTSRETLKPSRRVAFDP